MRIFIVEDQKVILQGIRKMFSHFSSDDIYTFSDPAEALAQAAHLRPDAIFTDIVMDGMNGLTLLNSISKILPKCRFVIISGHADFEYARQAIGLGVEEYLLKPIERKALEDIYHHLAGEVTQQEHANPDGFTRRNSLSEEAMSFICANCDRQLSIADVAAHIHISPNYLSNVFRKETGSSVTEAIRFEQMKAAARLLRNTDLYLYEIAERFGFKDVKYFSVLFKDYHQITPKSYRQKCLMEEENESDFQPE